MKNLKLLLPLLILNFICAIPVFASNIKLSQSDRSAIHKSFQDTLGQLTDRKFMQREGHKYKSSDSFMRDLADSMLSDLMDQGYISPNRIDAYYKKFSEISGPTISIAWLSSDRSDDINEWKSKYRNYLNWLFADMDINSSPCARYGELSNARVCCEGFAKAGFVAFKKFNNRPQCVQQGESCRKHSDCCSQTCDKDNYFDSNEQGTCAKVKSCYVPIQYGQECTMDEFPYCAGPKKMDNGQSLEVLCTAINYDSTGVKTYASIGQACSVNVDCASDKCVNQKCEKKYTCEVCVSKGQKKKDFPGIDCCKGTDQWGDNPYCRPIFPPFTIQSLLDGELIDIIKSKKSISDKASVLDILLSKLSVFSPATASTKLNCNFLTKDQEKEYSKAVNDALKNSDNPDLSLVQSNRDLWAAQNAQAEQEKLEAAINSCRENQTSEEGLANCISEAKNSINKDCRQSLSKSEFNDLASDQNSHLYTLLSEKNHEASKPEECRFNTYIDLFVGAPQSTQNAEIVMRAFEYIHTGRGVDDKWVQPNQVKAEAWEVKGNIFDRTNAVAKKFRAQRLSMIKNSKEADIKLMCSCVLGRLGKVPSDIRSKFDSQDECSSQRAQLENHERLTSEGSSTSQLSKNVGLGFVAMKVQDQLYDERISILTQQVTDLSPVQDELEELANFVDFNDPNQIENKWNKSTIKAKKIKEFEVKWTPAWIAIVLTIIVAAIIIAVSIATAGAGALTILGVAVAKGGLIAGGGVIAAGMIGVIAGYWGVRKKNILGTRDVIVKCEQGSSASSCSRANSSENYKTSSSKVSEDNPHGIKKFKWKWGFCRKRFIGICYSKGYKIQRFYDYDSYDNQQSEPRYQCKVENGSAEFCMENLFYAKHVADPEVAVRLMDLPKPLFVKADSYEVDGNFHKKVTANFDKNVIPALVNASPSGTIRRNKYRNYKDWLDDDRVVAALANTFRVEGAENENSHPAVNTTDPYSYIIKAFDKKQVSSCEAGAKKYAQCTLLKNCGASTNYVLEEDIGFGYLFSDNDDAARFAKYACSHHLQWPNMIPSEQIGYPKLGQGVYYRIIAHNLALTRTMFSKKFNTLTQEWEKFRAAWNLRKSKYNCAGQEKGVCSEEEGNASKNARFSRAAINAVGMIDFENGTGVDTAFKDYASYAKGGGKIGAGDLELLDSSKNLAFRNKKKKEAYAEFMESQKDNPRLQKILDGKSNFEKSMGSPLREMGGMSIGGRRLSGNQSPGVAKKSSDNKDKTDYKVSSYTPPKVPSYNYNSAGYGSSSTSSSNRGKIGKTGVSEDLSSNHLLDSAEQNMSSFKRDDADSIFKIVSKAYYRNLSLILKRKGAEVQSESGLDLKQEDKELTKDKKDELKNLLGN